jgi:hypothetical protein
MAHWWHQVVVERVADVLEEFEAAGKRIQDGHRLLKTSTEAGVGLRWIKQGKRS